MYVKIPLKFRLVQPALMWIIAIGGDFGIWRGVPGRKLFLSGRAGVMALALGIIVWAVVILASLLVHHKALTSVGNIDRLVTEGVYSRVRHPMYAAFIWLSWGAFLRWPTLRIAVMVLWTDMVLFLWSRLEERLLQARFGEEYSLYKKRVGMLIPRFRGVRN